MAAQARHYESKSISSYSSRQVDDKMISKSHRSSTFSKQASLDSSPYSKSNTHSPISRKRTLDSPSSRHGSPYERKKERLNNDGKISENQNDSDWSQHISSSGKIYYYNRKTEESQWEVPKDWKNREKQAKPIDRYSRDSKDLRDSRDSRDSRLSRDLEYTKDYDSRDKDRYNRDKRDYRDIRTVREKEKDMYVSSKDRDRFRDRDKDYRDHGISSTNGRYRNSNSGSNSRYNSSNVKSVGYSTPSSYTSNSGRYHHTPEAVNGTVQDISPPGTPTNDDIMNISSISAQTPSVYTPHGCSPLLNNSLTPVAAAAVAPHLIIPTTLHSPLLSPNLMLNPANHVAAILHPLQQALLLHQQQQIPSQLLTQAKDIYNSPKLPTIKNHYNDRSGSCPSSPLVVNFHQNNISHSSPTQRSMHSNSTTPPPPPPPPKEQSSAIDSASRHDRYHRTNSSFDTRHSDIPREILNRSKSNDNKLDDTPLRPSSYVRPNDCRHTSDRPPKKSAAKLFGQQQDHIDKMFDSLPDLDKYNTFYSSNIVDFTNNFYGNVLEKQATESWNDLNGSLHIDNCKTKNKKLIDLDTLNFQDTKLEISSSWYNALDDALTRMECLRNSLTSSRDVKTPSMSRSKSKQDLNISSSCPSPSTAGSVPHNNDTNPISKVNGIKDKNNPCDSTTTNSVRTNDRNHEPMQTGSIDSTTSQSEQVR